ncbi:hypothetical protein EC847_107142 [Scandinavium goeteborgense]|uniref:Uncharacterized protein n=2 Tax=Scandinavium goeteborgense TaxID=1851514 RepID=A0A4R6EI80_SCAGO|nr:hypothetical protein EC847_107142 [Scandinavium goeteborgense]
MNIITKPMIITVLIIPLSLPTMFFTLFYYVAHCRWLMSVTHLSGLLHWQRYSAQLCITLVVMLMVISLLSAALTALLVMLINKRVPSAKR